MILNYKMIFITVQHQSELKAKNKLSFKNSCPKKLFYPAPRTRGLVQMFWDSIWCIMLAQFENIINKQSWEVPHMCILAEVI